MSQTHPRYYAHDFERRWQKRLSAPPRRTPNESSLLHVEVIHRFPASNRYGWELRPVSGLAVEEFARSVRFLGGSQSGWQTRSEPIVATPLGSIECERRALEHLKDRAKSSIAAHADRYHRPTPFCQNGRVAWARWSSLGCRFGFDQFRCTRPPKLVVGRRSPRPCRPAALLQVVALLPVGSDISQGSQVCLRIAVLHELLHTDRREDFHDCGASLLSRKFVGGWAGYPPAERKSDDHRRDRADSYSL